MKIISEINRGGFGIIEKVQTDEGLIYARKTFSPNLPAGTDKKLLDKFRLRFIREVKTQEKLPPELFIPIIKSDLTTENPWYLMPLADKDFSQEIIDCLRIGAIPDGVSDILNSLEYLHKLGLVHRDLKPQNVLLHEGIWKLADFGLISADKDILSLSISSSGLALGTELYCAPEQVSDFKRVTHHADIYSFGAILHDIFGKGSRVPYSELKAEGHIGIIIGKCTKEKPEKRFKNIDSLRNILLTTLSASGKKTSNEDTNHWIDALKNIEDWNYSTLEAFIVYVDRNNSELKILLSYITKEILEKFNSIDTNLFNEFNIAYLDWVYKSSFDFNFCDVIIGVIKQIYILTTDLEVKSKAVLSGAELGYGHNRWYVMGIVIGMADKDIEDELAERIAIEIHVGGDKDKNNLKMCARQVRRPIEAYHKIIQEALV